MKNKIFAIFAISVCFLGGIALAVFMNAGKTKKPPINAIDPVEIKSTLSDQEVYAYSYNRGYNAFMTQINRDDLMVDNNKVYTYTSDKKKTEHEKELESRAYVEGYHRAADAIYCPRQQN